MSRIGTFTVANPNLPAPVHVKRFRELDAQLQDAMNDALQTRVERLAPTAARVTFPETNLFLNMLSDHFPKMAPAIAASAERFSNVDSAARAFLDQNDWIPEQLADFKNKVAHGDINYALTYQKELRPGLNYTDFLGLVGRADAGFRDPPQMLTGGGGSRFIAPPSTGAAGPAAGEQACGPGHPNFNQGFYDNVVGRLRPGETVSGNFANWQIFCSDNTLLRQGQRPTALPAFGLPVSTLPERGTAPAPAPRPAAAADTPKKPTLGQLWRPDLYPNAAAPAAAAPTHYIPQTPTTRPIDSQRALRDSVRQELQQLSDSRLATDPWRAFRERVNTVETRFETQGGCDTQNGYVTTDFRLMRHNVRGIEKALPRLEARIAHANANPESADAWTRLDKDLDLFRNFFVQADHQVRALSITLEHQAPHVRMRLGSSNAEVRPPLTISDPGPSTCGPDQPLPERKDLPPALPALRSEAALARGH